MLRGDRRGFPLW